MKVRGQGLGMPRNRQSGSAQRGKTICPRPPRATGWVSVGTAPNLVRKEQTGTSASQTRNRPANQENRHEAGRPGSMTQRAGSKGSQGTGRQGSTDLCATQGTVEAAPLGLAVSGEGPVADNISQGGLHKNEATTLDCSLRALLPDCSLMILQNPGRV